MAKASLLVHFSLVLASCFTVYGVELDTVSSIATPPPYHAVTPAMAPAPSPHHNHPHDHIQPPTASPVHAPTHPPTHAPSHPPSHVAPTHPPTPSYHFPRSLVEVQGVVYCKSCKYAGADTLLGATPVLGATVKLQCNNTKYPLKVVSKTDNNGYFRIKAAKTITNFGAHKCKVFLISSPSAFCQKPSTFHSGATGAALRPESLSATKPPVALYSVGPLAFEPKCPH